MNSLGGGGPRQTASFMDIRKKHSTKVERILADMFIKARVPFKFREVISGRECDFIIGRVVIEVDGVIHRQKRAKDISKNEMLVRLGYTPLHFSAKEIRNNTQEVFREIKKLVAVNK